MNDTAEWDGHDLRQQDRLKCLLQQAAPGQLEKLAAALLGNLIGVSIAVASSGFQHGGDAGPVGRQGRRFRVEAKRYGDGTPLSSRELLGEIDHALNRDAALEAWLLVATRDVPEQIEQDLQTKGEGVGVPIVILDWKPGGIAVFSALCAVAPNVVGDLISADAGNLARALQSVAAEPIARLRRDLMAWNLGYARLRAVTQDRLNRIWTRCQTSKAALGQDAAGGAQPHRVRRRHVHTALDNWWRTSAEDAPAALIGLEGVGKTWAALDWLVDRLDEQPLVLVVPSSAVASFASVSAIAIKRFLADRLCEITEVRDQEHWLRRLDRLLLRPREEGPVLTIFFDGLNQEHSAQWQTILRILQDDAFTGRVRVIASTRKLHFTERLGELRGLIVRAVVIPVEIYDTEPGGELDQMLGFEGLTRSDLPPDLIPLARNPRLFALVVSLRVRLGDVGPITVHRLLWEYGRDTFGTRAGKSFSEEEWREWLQEIARSYRGGNRVYTRAALGETTKRPDLTASDVFARLSDIIDGRFVTLDPSGLFHPTATLVAHALGAALLAHLDGLVTPSFEAVDAELGQWLDPIAGLDERAGILRAAVSILVERGQLTSAPTAGALVTSWLQTQNIPEDHRFELARLSADLIEPLLDAIQHSASYVQTSARQLAVGALREVPRSSSRALKAVVDRASRWLSVVSRDTDRHQASNAEVESRRAKRFIDRIGCDRSGPMTVLGLAIELVDQDHDSLAAVVPSLLEGFPLTSAMPVFEVAAVGLAISGRCDCWDSLRWLCLLNDVDPEATAISLRHLSDAVKVRLPEPGIHPDLRCRAAALLLWLTGYDSDDAHAADINPKIGKVLIYEENYLPDPGRSIFTLERHHAEAVLEDRTLPLAVRALRVGDLWTDPTFAPPDGFRAELEAAVVDYPVEALDAGRGRSVEDHAFEEIEPALARCKPDLLAELLRRKMANFATRPLASRALTSHHGTDHLLLIDAGSGPAARGLRLSESGTRPGRDMVCANNMLMLELLDEPAFHQVASLVDADLSGILADVGHILKPLTTAEVDALISRYGSGTPKQAGDLVLLLSFQGGPISDAAWAWLSTRALDDLFEHHGVACELLVQIDAVRFGRELLRAEWSWSHSRDLQTNHYGSMALIAASLGLAFEEVAPRLAPWMVLAAVSSRGAVPAEARLAADIFGSILVATAIDPPDPGSLLSIDRSKTGSDPFAFSITPQPFQEGPENPLDAFKARMDFEAHSKACKRAVDTAIARIEMARASGASLYLANLEAEDFIPVLRYARGAVEAWLEGAAERSPGFRRRVQLAEGAYLALCEALLIVEPEQGVILWRSLRGTLMTRFIGAGKVDELVHIVFRAPHSYAIDALMADLISLHSAKTDQDLMDVSIAAAVNGRTDWLRQVIANDAESKCSWRRRRADSFSGFLTGSALPVTGAWPEGRVDTERAERVRKAARRRSMEACAHHWWRAYVDATSTEEAYAAWVLFMHSADRRAWVWLVDDIDHLPHDDLSRKKRIHANLNRHRLDSSMKRREKDLRDHFLGRRTVKDIGPWRLDRS